MSTSARALVVPEQRLVSAGDTQLRVKNVKDAVQRVGVGVIRDFPGTVFGDNSKPPASLLLGGMRGR